MPNTAPTTSFSITSAPVTADGTPDALPWAIDGTLAAPVIAQEEAGFAPYPAAPPIFSLENFSRYYISQWLERLSACGIFAQRATSRITIGGTVTAGNTYTLDDGTNTDTYTATSADAAAVPPLLSVVTNWAQQLRTGDLRLTLSGSVGGTGLLDVIYRDPGTDWPAGTPTVSEVGSGTIAIVDRYGGTAGQLSVMTSQAGTGASACDLLHGIGDPEGAATKLQFRKDAKNGAFRAGKWTGTEANLANVGSGSAAFGLDTTASGLDSFAAGDSTVASGQDSTALGNGSTASGDQSLAAGDTCTASGQAAVALGTGNTASGDYSTATGRLCVAATNYSNASGYQASPKTLGETAHASGNFSAAGDAQMGVTVFRRTAVDNTGMIVTTDGTGSGISIYLQSSMVYAISLQVAAKWLSGAGGGAAVGDGASWALDFMASVDNAGAVTITGMASTNVAPSQSVGQGSTYRLGHLLTTPNTFILRAFSGNVSNTISVTGSSRHTNT